MCEARINRNASPVTDEALTHLGYQYQQGDVLIAVDEWKGDGRVAPVISYGARAFFEQDLHELFRLLASANAATWHARKPRHECGFLFGVPAFHEIMKYLESADTRHYGMIRNPEQFLAQRILAQAATAREQHPDLADVLPENANALSLFWFLDRVLHSVKDTCGSRPIRVFIDRLDWRSGDAAGGRSLALRPYGVPQSAVAVYEVLARDALLTDVGGLLGVAWSRGLRAVGVWAVPDTQVSRWHDTTKPLARVAGDTS